MSQFIYLGFYVEEQETSTYSSGGIVYRSQNRNPVFRMLVLCIEKYSQAYMSDNLQMEVAFV